MDMFFKVVAGIIAIPFFLWGLSLIMEFLLGSGIGIAAAFTSVWNKETKLSFKDGLLMGVGFIIIHLFISGFFWWFIGIRATATSTIHGLVKGIYEMLGFAFFVVALIRLKFKFALGYLLSVIGISVFLILLISIIWQL